jgi:hypothetical protein
VSRLTGYLSGRIYYEKRAGWRWEVWYAYQDGQADPHSGATEWKASSVKYWRWINAARAANSMWTAFNDGVWCEGGRSALAQSEEK